MSRVGELVDYDDYPIERLAFEEPFTGASLNGNLWNRQLRWGKGIIINNEEQIYDDGSIGADVLRFEGTHATLRCIETPPELLSAASANDKGTQRNMPYISTALSTYDKFHIGDSHAEIEIWLPGTPGTSDSDGAFPAFWRQGQFFSNGGYGKYAGKILTEHDDMEWTGNTPNALHFSTHEDPGATGNLISSGSKYDTGKDLRGGWHKFGSRIDGEKILFLLDDTFVFEKPRPRSWEETMFFNLNLAISDGQTGFGSAAQISASTVLPMEMKVRNMRVWPLANKRGRIYRVPSGYATQKATTTAGVPICHRQPDVAAEFQRSKVISQTEIYVPYLNASGEEMPYTGNRGDLYNNSTPGVSTNPKVVVWSMKDHQNAILFLHRHMVIHMTGAVPGGEYNIVISRVQHPIAPVFYHPTLKPSKAAIDSVPQYNDDAHVTSLYQFTAHDAFLLLTAVNHY